MKQKRHLQIFISHCSDTNKDIEVIRRVIDSINQDLDDYHLDLFEHKSDATPEAGHPQEVIFEQCPVDTWDIYIGILYNRFGTPLEWNGEKYESGVELEFKEAYEHWKNSEGKRPKILFYRSETPTNPAVIDVEQLKKVQEFFSKYKDKIYYSSYKKLEDLKNKIGRDIRKVIREINQGKKQSRIIQPTLIYNRVKLEYFSGREWLEEKLDSFLKENSKGYFLIEASAGLGKTTFVAHLVKERKYIYLFCEQFSDSLPKAIEHIARQMDTRFGLDLVEKFISDPDYVFGELLEKAAKEAKKRKEKLVIAIDALDELSSYERGNVLGLPNYEEIPENVYFILTARPIDYILATNKTVVTIDARGKYNIRDIKEYLSVRYDRDKGLKNALKKENIDKEQFVSKLSEKSQGMWIYLHYVLEEIKKGKRTPLELDALPNGVEEYYLGYWLRWEKEHKDEWEDAKRLLVVLASLKEAVTSETLSAFTEFPQERIDALLRSWAPFIDRIERDEIIKYKLYHKSLSDFITKPLVNPNTHNAEERRFQKELIRKFYEINVSICGYYLEEVFDEFIDSLMNDKKNPELIYVYGRKHLIDHICHVIPKAKYGSELASRLKLWLGRTVFNVSEKPNLWYRIREKYNELDEYGMDIDLLLRVIGNVVKARDFKHLIPFYMGLFLMKSIFYSRNRNYPPEILFLALKLNYWPFKQVLFLLHF